MRVVLAITPVPEMAGPAGGPLRLRAMLHVARALLVQSCDGIPGGLVDWTHARAIDVQLAELAWGALTPEERAEGDAAFRAVHLCRRRNDLGSCDLPRRVAALAAAQRGAA